MLPKLNFKTKITISLYKNFRKVRLKRKANQEKKPNNQTKQTTENIKK